MLFHNSRVHAVAVFLHLARQEGGKTSFVCINQHGVHLSAVLKRVRAGECMLEKFSWTCDKEPGFSMITFGLQGCGDGLYLYCDCISGDIIRLYILIGLLKECASGFQMHNSPGIREKLWTLNDMVAVIFWYRGANKPQISAPSYFVLFIVHVWETIFSSNQYSISTPSFQLIEPVESWNTVFISYWHQVIFVIFHWINVKWYLLMEQEDIRYRAAPWGTNINTGISIFLRHNNHNFTSQKWDIEWDKVCPYCDRGIQ